MNEIFGSVTTTPINPNKFSGGGSTTVDQTYKPESENAQSGKAVAEAIVDKSNLEVITLEKTPEIEKIIIYGEENLINTYYRYIGDIEETDGVYSNFVYETNPNNRIELKFINKPIQLIEGCLTRIAFEEKNDGTFTILDFVIFKDVSDKQDKLTAGEGINIDENNVISVKGGGSEDKPNLFTGSRISKENIGLILGDSWHFGDDEFESLKVGDFYLNIDENNFYRCISVEKSENMVIHEWRFVASGSDVAPAIKRTILGTTIEVNDVSPLEHELDIQLTSDTVNDFSNISIGIPKNEFSYPYSQGKVSSYGITWEPKPDGSIVANGTATATSRFYIKSNVTLKSGKLFVKGMGSYYSENEICIMFNNIGYVYADDIIMNIPEGYNQAVCLSVPSGVILNNLTIHPLLAFYYDDESNYTEKANADGTVKGFKSVSPNMTLVANSDKVIINCTYNVDLKKYIDSSSKATDESTLDFKVDLTKNKTFDSLFNNSGNMETFLFFTDPHYVTDTSINWLSGYENHLDIIKEHFNNSDIGFVLCGGDWLDKLNTQAHAQYMLYKIKQEMRKSFDKYYMVLGNHDTNYQGVNDSGEANKGILDQQTINDLWFEEYGKSYYTFKGANTKFYVFDCGTDSRQNGSVYYEPNDSDNKQVVFFLEELEKNNDKHIALAPHMIYLWGEHPHPLTRRVAEIANIYNNRGTITESNKIYDFSQKTGKVEFIIAGHMHADSTGTLHDIPYIQTINASVNTDYPSFDLVMVDYTERKLKTVRVGTGADRELSLD